MTDNTNIAALNLGDEISASVTVRGYGVTEASGIALGSASLDAWQRAQSSRLADGLKFEPKDSFADKPQGEHSVTRVLKVVSA